MAAVNTRVQLTDAERKVICELARDNKTLSQDLIVSDRIGCNQSQEIWFETPHSHWHLEQDLTGDELVALVKDKPQAESVEDISDCELTEDVVSAPSLPEI